MSKTIYYFLIPSVKRVRPSKLRRNLTFCPSSETCLNHNLECPVKVARDRYIAELESVWTFNDGLTNYNYCHYCYAARLVDSAACLDQMKFKKTPWYADGFDSRPRMLRVAVETYPLTPNQSKAVENALLEMNLRQFGQVADDYFFIEFLAGEFKLYLIPSGRAEINRFTPMTQVELTEKQKSQYLSLMVLTDTVGFKYLSNILPESCNVQTNDMFFNYQTKNGFEEAFIQPNVNDFAIYPIKNRI